MKRSASLFAIAAIAFAAACAVGTDPTGQPLGSPPEAESSTDPSNDDSSGSIAPEAGGGAADAGPTSNKSKDSGSSADTSASITADAGQANDDAGPTCPGYAYPTEDAPCHACTTATKPNCQPNHCYGGYFCDVAQTKCVPPPSGC